MIHKSVFDELDSEIKGYISAKKIQLVDEGDLYMYDPQYITIFNNIAGHKFFNYHRGNLKNKGEIYSLAYAAYYGIPFFSSKDASVDW